MKFGFYKIACVTPEIFVADCRRNAQSIAREINRAAEDGAEIICLPELCITGYTCGDLFLQPVLLQGAQDALVSLCKSTASCPALIAVGAPLRHGGKLYNCAVLMQGGRILGAVPKTYLPNYSEFYEMRHFSPAPLENSGIVLAGASVPFGTKLLLCCEQDANLCVGVEICEDLWAPLPPSTFHAMAGATLLLNLSASDETIGKAEYRRALVCGQSARLLCAYAYCDAGKGESTTDMVFAGHNLIAENGTLLAQTELFSGSCAMCEVDVERLAAERARNTSFCEAQVNGYEKISFKLPQWELVLTRRISGTPFVPQNDAERAKSCDSILAMQAAGLQKRLEHTHCRTAVLGISGGLDSSLALLVLVRAFTALQKPLSDIIAVTMPCFGTTKRTKSNAEKLCLSLGVTLKEVNITETVKSNFADIGHDATVQDVTFENVQARVRTLVLMNLANQEQGIVIGTGDLSELALGWATYNGDHMSMYGVNASVPKTLIRHLVDHVARQSESALAAVLHDILATPVSPELLPAENGEISQQTEALVGPYELHDFFLYYAIRWSFSPRKIFVLAQAGFGTRYPRETLLKWLRNFYHRFFAQQFKRSCLPDGPKVGSVALSPRGDWRMPSDACADLWLAELEDLCREG